MSETHPNANRVVCALVQSKTGQWEGLGTKVVCIGNHKLCWTLSNAMATTLSSHSVNGVGLCFKLSDDVQFGLYNCKIVYFSCSSVDAYKLICSINWQKQLAFVHSSITVNVAFLSIGNWSIPVCMLCDYFICMSWYTYCKHGYIVTV